MALLYIDAVDRLLAVYDDGNSDTEPTGREPWRGSYDNLPGQLKERALFPKVVLIGLEPGTDKVLEQQPLASEGRNERWLRDFLFDHPEALPAAAIDPAFADLVPVCRELRTIAGPVDVLFVNRQGALVLVECKLWRNPEARREVVGQILDYAKELARWRYEDLQREVSRARGEPGVNAVFNAVAAAHPEIREAEFVDQVSRNLSSGRFLLLVVGDGIREGTENIVQFVARHSGLHFTFGLVEVVSYGLPDGRLIVQPRLLARTVNLTRAVVRVENIDTTVVDEPEDVSDDVSPSSRSPELIEADRALWQKFIERLRLDDPSQTPPRPAGLGWVRLDLGVDYGWMTAYTVRAQNRIGSTAVLKGEAGLRCYKALETERADIDAELGAAVPNAVVDWGGRDDRAWVGVYRILPGSWNPAQDEENLPWLLRATNAMVNSIRPRVQRYSLEPS